MDVIINAEITCDFEENNSPSRENFYSNLLRAVGYAANPPVGDLLRHFHHLEGQWLVVSPIHWQATHNDAMIMACGDELQWSEEESQRWFAAFTEFVAAENMLTYYHDASTWLLQYNERPPIDAKPVHLLLNQSMMPELQRLDASLFWQRFITEIQMYFSGHSLNRGRPDCPINGVWFWGSGQLHAPEDKLVICSSSLFNLARLISTQVRIYQPTQSYVKNSVILLDKSEAMTLQSLQTKLQKYTVHWYWNNYAYTNQPKGWLTRLWR